MITLIGVLLRPDWAPLSARRAPLLRAGQTPFQPLPARLPDEPAGHERATPMTPVGSRNVGASHRAPEPSLAGHRSCTKSLSSRDERGQWFPRDVKLLQADRISGADSGK